MPMPISVGHFGSARLAACSRAQALVVHRLQHLVERGVVVAAVQRPAEAGGVGELLGLDEIAAPDLGLVDAELLRQHVDHALDQVDRLGHAQRAAIGHAARRLVGEHRVHPAIGVRDLVRAGADGEQAGRELGRRHVRVERAVVRERREAQALDAPVLVGGQLAHAVVVAREAGGRDVVDARLDPLHRHAGDDRGDDGHHVARVDRHLVAEAAADVAADHADLALGDAREHRQHGAEQVRDLRRHVEGEVAGRLVERGDAAAGLQRAGVHARVEDLLAHRDRRALEGGVGRGLVAGFPGEDVVRVRARAVRQVLLVDDVLAQDRRIRQQRLLRVDDRRQLLVVHLHQRDAVGGGVAVGGQHHGHVLHLEVHLLVGQHCLHVAAHGGHPVQLDRLQVVGGEHRHHARAGQRLALVDALDARVRVRAAHDGAEQHAGHLDVVDVGALAADEAGVLLAQQRGAHALQFVFAFLQFGCLPMRCLR